MALSVPRACVEKMLARGYINPLGDGTRRGICLIRGLIVQANHPVGNGTGAECGGIHLNMAWILTWLGALQPNAGDSCIFVVISMSRTAAIFRSAATIRRPWAVATYVGRGSRRS